MFKFKIFENAQISIDNPWNLFLLKNCEEMLTWRAAAKHYNCYKKRGCETHKKGSILNKHSIDNTQNFEMKYLRLVWT